MNKRAKKQRAKRIIKATSFALAVAAFSAAIYTVQLKEVNINYHGENMSFRTFASTVKEALKEQNINVKDTEEFSADINGKLDKNNIFTIIEKPVVLAKVEPVVEEAPVVEETKIEEPVVVVLEEKKEEPKVEKTTEKKKATNVTSRGKVRTTWGPDVYQKEEGILEASDGTLIEYEAVMQLEATAYCACHECCGKWPGNKWYGITATGTKAKVGTIAVDPRVIPLGTQVYIEGLYGAKNYGYGSAEDTGGAIKGNIIDVYFDSKSKCESWGRRHNVEVNIRAYPGEW